MPAPDPAQQHHDAAKSSGVGRSIAIAVLTISDTRSLAGDGSGDAIVLAINDAGYTVADRSIVRDDPHAIKAALDAWIGHREIDVIITTGGTGIARRDNTIDIVRRLLTAKLEGFGELFRMLSYEQIGSAAMLSRSVAGLVANPDDAGGDTFVFALPGSTKAVELAMKKLIVPELPHLVWQRR